ncbi:MAG: hypothetical protein LBD90_00560 [Bifidobacteriaceae bacterium]|jgi:hypothetical protein|nr:hypothetical protein [Bifidobacteriaceae bacterium]
MPLAQLTAIADRPAPVPLSKSAKDVEASIAAWLSIVGDRNSCLRRALWGGNEIPPDPDSIVYEDLEIDDALLRRLLVGLSRIPA